MKAALLLAYLPNDAEANRELPKFKIPENVPDKFPEAELEQLGKTFVTFWQILGNKNFR